MDDSDLSKLNGIQHINAIALRLAIQADNGTNLAHVLEARALKYRGFILAGKWPTDED